jgi:4-hydroxy-tetrahydrodipicolinate synthase
MTFEPGLVHTPLTPFSPDRRIDFDVYARSIEFHVRHGADALAVPMHCGESVSLTDAERRKIIAFAVEHAAKRVPVIAHVSDAGTGIAAGLAKHAQAAGAAAIVATTPYYWTPPPAMVLEHFC